MESFISSEQGFGVAAVVLALVGLGFWFDQSRFGRIFPGVLIVLLGGIALVNLYALPRHSPVYSSVGQYIVPLSIPLILFKANLRRILKQMGPMLVCFAIAAFATLLGATVAFFTIDLGTVLTPYKDDLTGIYAATYIGGSMNFVAVAKTLGFDNPTLYAAALAADVAAGVIFLFIIVALPSWAFIQRFFVIGSHEQTPAEAKVAKSRPSHGAPFDITLSLALAAAICAGGMGLATTLGVPKMDILIITALTVALATMFPALMGRWHYDSLLGTVGFYAFFAIIGIETNIPELLGVDVGILLFAMVILAVHLVVVLAAAKLFKLDLARVLVTSNACVLGPATAAVMASSLHWPKLIEAAIMCGVLGYAMASFLGISLAQVLSGLGA